MLNILSNIEIMGFKSFLPTLGFLHSSANLYFNCQHWHTNLRNIAYCYSWSQAQCRNHSIWINSSHTSFTVDAIETNLTFWDSSSSHTQTYLSFRIFRAKECFTIIIKTNVSQNKRKTILFLVLEKQLCQLCVFCFLRWPALLCLTLLLSNVTE